MRIAVLLAILFAAAPAQAEKFISPGFSVAYGTRGWSFGVEVSAGIVGNTVPIFPGVVAGFEVSPFARSGQPWGRAYGEVEFVTLFAGIGVGPAFLLGDNAEASLQLTPFLAIPTAFITDKSRRCHESLPIVVPFYRYTTSSNTSGFHDAGLFGKAVWVHPDDCSF